MLLLLFSVSVVINALWPPWTAATRIPRPQPSPRACSNSCPLNWWCHPTISSSVTPFSSCLQSFSATRSFSISGLFTSGGLSIAVSASTSILPMNIQGLFPLGLTGLISLLSKGLSKISSTTYWKYLISVGQLSSWSKSHIHTYYWTNQSFDSTELCQQSYASAF